MPNRSKAVARCVGTGFIALDIIRSALDESTTLERRHAGGSCGNVLAILSYLGVQTSAVGRIGNDASGAELLADLRRSKVDIEFLVIEEGRRTPIVIQESFLDRRGNPRHRFSRACPVCGATMPGYRPLLAADVAEVASALPAHEFFFFDRVARGTVELARRSKEQGALVVFEPSGIKDEGIFVECLRASHVLKYSHERLSGIDALVAQARPQLEIETLGAEGLRFRARTAGRSGGWKHLAALPALSVRDSVGSGDWSTAGFVAGLAGDSCDAFARLNDREAVIEGLQFGQALAALNCSYDGARGLMYAMARSKALRAAERVLANGAPKLPERSAPPAAIPGSGRACVVCASALHTTHAQA